MLSDQLKMLVVSISKQKTFNVCGALFRGQFSATKKSCYYTTAAQPKHYEENEEPAQGKPLSECPTATPWEMIRGFLPGGKFYKKDINDFVRLLLKEKGGIVFMPGSFGKDNMAMTENPVDFEKVYRYEGVWPIRKGIELLTYHRKEYRKEYFENNSGLVASQDKEWADFRSTVNPIVIHPKNIKLYLGLMAKVNEEFIEKIKKIRDPKTFEVPDDFKNEISRWTLESVSVVALDKQLGFITHDNPDGKRIFTGLQRFFDISVDLEIKPAIWRIIPTAKFKEAMAILDELTSIIEKYIKEAVERIEKSNGKKSGSESSVLEKLLKIDRKIAIVMALDMLSAGVDTTTTIFTGLLLCLARNPEKQQKLREEVLKILPHKNSPLTEENMKNLPYLRSCIKESFRYYPLASGNVRTLTQDLVLSGYQIPKGTMIAMINVNLLRDPKHYSEPAEFIPERWLRQSAKEKNGMIESCPHAASAATKSNHPFVYLPFGFGPRSCIGRRIAEMELEIGIARIVRNFNVEFNYPVENAFKSFQINIPAIPLKFKFTDLPN